MTREQIKQLWPVLEAFRDGKVVQIRENGEWRELLNDNPQFGWPADSYRVIVTPEPMRVWVNVWIENGEIVATPPYKTRDTAEAQCPCSARTVRFTEDPEP